MKTPPIIRLRGIRQVIPSGYYIGRLSPGAGDAELVHMSMLGAQMVKSGQVAPAGPAEPCYLGFHLDGPFDAITSYGGAISANAIVFPSNPDVSFATCETAAATAFTCYLVTNLASFLASGPPNGAIAHIDFAEAATTGTITWYAGSVTVAAHTKPYVVVNNADLTLAGVSLLFAGDPVI